MHGTRLDMIAHLLPAILPRWTILALVAWLSTLVLAIWAWERVQETPPATLPPDTVRLQRTITKTDTVTETVPRTVVRYDTVRVTDTLKMPVPQVAGVLGVLAPSPIDLGTKEATLTYWTGTQWQQNVYDVPRPSWSLSAGAEVVAGPHRLAFVPTAELGWRDWALRVGYALGPHRGVTVGLRWHPVRVRW